LLFLITVKDDRAVLRPNVRPLPVLGRRIVNGEEHFENLTQRNHLWIERYLHYFGMTGCPGAYLFVGGAVSISARKAGLDLFDAFHLCEHRLDAPETPSAQRNALTTLLSHSFTSC